PALLTFFIRLFVPESERWQHEQRQGSTSHWATRDLLGVLGGSAAAGGIIVLWAMPLHLAIRIPASVLLLVVVTAGYIFPVVRYQQRSAAAERTVGVVREWMPTVRRMLLAACLSGVALLGTWASIQRAPLWGDELSDKEAQERTRAAAV